MASENPIRLAAPSLRRVPIPKIPGALEQAGIGGGVAQSANLRYDLGAYRPDGGSTTKRLLIVSPGNFIPSLQNFVSHKMSRGWQVEILDTATAVESTSLIRAQIQMRYTNELSRPSHLLLVGDTDKLPAWSGKGAYLPATDLYYACMDGTEDWLPDMAYGRFPARTTAQLTNMIAKTIAYENQLSGQIPYLQSAVFITSEDGYALTEGTHNAVISQYMEPLGYQSTKLYRHTYAATTSVVTNSLNAGCALVAFSGHGLPNQWRDPLVSSTNLLALTNNLRLPFVMSFACDTGSYRDSDECFAEAWLRAPYARGAVVVLASSQDTYWEEDDVFERAVFAALFEGQDAPIGDAVLDAKLRYLALYGTGPETLQYFEQYNLFGDPTLRLVRYEQPAGPTLGILAIPSNGAVQLTITGKPGRSYSVQVSTNLAGWTTWTNVVSTNGTSILIDTGATNFPRRFYRAIMP